MNEGQIINDIYFQDHETISNYINVLFLTTEGNYIYKDLNFKPFNNIDFSKWKKFEQFNILRNPSIIEWIKYENDMSMHIKLKSDFFISVYFNLSYFVENNSTMTLSIFNKDEISKEMLAELK